MKKYHYKDTKVIEKSTSFIIKNCKTKNEAKKLTGKLNGGSGFQGETPKFFVYAKDQ
jgi:uncharacterized lipoprotein YehR (DUF1307 family)